jgi:hypothetical protein
VQIPRCATPHTAESGRASTACVPMTRYRVDAKSAAIGIPVAAYLIVLGLIALSLYSLLQPRYIPNPGLAAYKPPPATVISYEMPARLLAQHGQAPPLAEIESQAEEPQPTVVASKPERSVDVKKPKRPKVAARSRERHYAASYRWYRGNRSFAYSWHGGYRPF